MKKIIAIILTLVLLAIGAASFAEGNISGGWAQTQETVITEDAQAAFDKVMEDFVGSDIVPEALLATQVVAGTNYCFLARVTPVVPNAESHYAFVYIYADLNGGAEILDIRDIEFGI